MTKKIIQEAKICAITLLNAYFDDLAIRRRDVSKGEYYDLQLF